jgi:hypothetical protein
LTGSDQLVGWATGIFYSERLSPHLLSVGMKQPLLVMLQNKVQKLGWNKE